MLLRPVLAAVLAALFATSCGGPEHTMSTACPLGGLATTEAGRLTLSTGVITRAPWVTGPHEPGRSADPRHGQGYDAAVGFALADRLGYDREHVTWVATPFADVLRSGPKGFDVNVNQVTIRADRARDVDLSRPYYRARLAVVTLEGNPLAQAGSLEDLRKGTFAVVKDSAPARAVADLLAPRTPATAYPDLDEVRRAVGSGARDALVVDYVTALRLDADETTLVGGKLAGVLPAVADQAEEYGLVLAKGSSLTPCVNAALEELERDGTLLELERRWLVDAPGWRWLD